MEYLRIATGNPARRASLKSRRLIRRSDPRSFEGFLDLPQDPAVVLGLEREVDAEARRAALSRVTQAFASSHPAGAATAGALTGVARHIRRASYIDDEIFGALDAARIVPAPPSSDAEFLRRATLDLTGRIPDAGAVTAFLADPSSDKRSRMIDALLASDAFVDRWAFYYDELFRNTSNADSGQLYFTGRNAYHAYFVDAVRSHKPYDQMARELLSGAGVNTTHAPANFSVRNIQTNGPAQDTYDNQAATTGTALLGESAIFCTSCHNGAGHLDQINLWGSTVRRQDFWGMAAFFAKVRMPRTGTQASDYYYTVIDDPALWAGLVPPSWGSGNQFRTPSLSSGQSTLSGGLTQSISVPFDDVNGDSIRQETELSIPRSEISVTDRSGAVSLTGTTLPGSEPFCFKELPEDDYNISVAVPDGYNPTTVLNYALKVEPGDRKRRDPLVAPPPLGKQTFGLGDLPAFRLESGQSPVGQADDPAVALARLLVERTQPFVEPGGAVREIRGHERMDDLVHERPAARGDVHHQRHFVVREEPVGRARRLLEDCAAVALVARLILEQPDVEDLPWIVREVLGLQTVDGPANGLLAVPAHVVRGLIADDHEGTLDDNRESRPGELLLKLCDVALVVGRGERGQSFGLQRFGASRGGDEASQGNNRRQGGNQEQAADGMRAAMPTRGGAA